jgi:hypothetical protein
MIECSQGSLEHWQNGGYKHSRNCSPDGADRTPAPDILRTSVGGTLRTGFGLWTCQIGWVIRYILQGFDVGMCSKRHSNRVAEMPYESRQHELRDRK